MRRPATRHPETAIEVTRLGRDLAAAVSGVDLSAPLSDGVIAAMRGAALPGYPIKGPRSSRAIWRTCRRSCPWLPATPDGVECVAPPRPPPERLYVIDAAGRVAFKTVAGSPGFDPEALGRGGRAVGGRGRPGGGVGATDPFGFGPPGLRT